MRDNEVLAYTPCFGLDGIHRTGVTVEEIYLPKEQVIVNSNRPHGGVDVTIFKHSGPRVSNAINFFSEPEAAKNLRVIRLEKEVADSISALARLTEEMEKHKAVLSSFFDKMENENRQNAAHVSIFDKPLGSKPLSK